MGIIGYVFLIWKYTLNIAPQSVIYFSPTQYFDMAKLLQFIILSVFFVSCDTTLTSPSTCYSISERLVDRCDLDGTTTALIATVTQEDAPLKMVLREATTANYTVTLTDSGQCTGTVEVKIEVNGTEIENSVQISFPKSFTIPVQGVQSIAITLQPKQLDQDCLCPDPINGGAPSNFNIEVVLKKM
jgi:hypothetical protein